MCINLHSSSMHSMKMQDWKYLSTELVLAYALLVVSRVYFHHPLGPIPQPGNFPHESKVSSTEPPRSQNNKKKTKIRCMSCTWERFSCRDYSLQKLSSIQPNLQAWEYSWWESQTPEILETVDRWKNCFVGHLTGCFKKENFLNTSQSWILGCKDIY